ncbi:MAG TPA: Crp/Fnr family transcriptional regulator [Woeseiaceae bacterium]|nr:Crp/Fnr family transcriptional regulator [Woeseiaceae bacterium]
MDETAHTLEGIGIFHALTAAERRRISLQCQWLRYNAGQLILGQFDITRDIFFVVSGRARATSYSLSGKEVSYRDIEAGDMFGEFSAIDDEPRSADVVALSDCLVARLSNSAFWQILRDYPEISAAMLKRLTRQIRAMTERVFEFSALAVNNRIHAELLRLALSHKTAPNTALIQPAPTHAELASRLGTHREAVTRELNALARTGLLQRRRGALHINDIAELQRLVETVVGQRS